MTYKQSAVAILLCFVFFSCATAPVAPPSASYEKQMALAIWDLENLSPGGNVVPDLGELLSARITETVQEAEEYTVVEREKLNLALAELNLGSSLLADKSTRLRIGRLVGAGLMIFGAYQVIADQMRLDLRMVEVETGRILKATEKTAAGGDLAGWLKAAEEAARELI